MFKTDASIPAMCQPPRTLAPRPNAIIIDDAVLAYHGKWQARCLDIACYLDEKHHMSVCSVMFLVSTRQAPALRLILARSTPFTYYEMKRPSQKGQFNICVVPIWQHDFGSPREPPFKKPRFIKFLCPDISRQVGVGKLSIHIEGFHA